MTPERGLDESVTAFTMRRFRNAVIEECAACVPATWLDPMPSGPEAVVVKDCGSVERVLSAVAARIRSLKEGATR